MENVGVFYGHLVYFTPNHVFLCHLAYFLLFDKILSWFGMVYQEKSGNPGWNFLSTVTANVFLAFCSPPSHCFSQLRKQPFPTSITTCEPIYFIQIFIGLTGAAFVI
jgi:hypothetical protein